MKQLFTLFLFINTTIQSQNYTEVDVKVKDYPKFSSAQELATRIHKDFVSDSNKVRAAFIWLTKNIKYDLNEYYNPTSKRIKFKYSSEKEKQQKLQIIKNQIVDKTFNSKKSVCEGYAQSFKKICDLLYIEAVVIKGYARNSSNDIGVIPKNSNHAWNAVKINNKWRLIDATWAAGYIINKSWKKKFIAYYFYPNPEELLATHFPENNVWQLIKKPISEETYASQPIISQQFFYRGLKLISERNGIIYNKKQIVIKIKNLASTDIIGYQFKDQRFGKRGLVSFNNSIGSFTINLKNKRKTELYIFINNELALEYKIR